jgi:putative transposase
MVRKCSIISNCNVVSKPVCSLAQKQSTYTPNRCSLQPNCTANLDEHHFIETPIACKWCGSTDIKKYGSRKGVQEYLCLKCGRKFIAKDAPYKKQTSSEQIGLALDSFYDGLSFQDITRQLEHSYQNHVVESTVYRWVMSYTEKAINILGKLQPKVSDTWVVDETVIKVGGTNWWFWDVIDEDTRFLIASHLSLSRTTRDASSLMEKAWRRADKAPKVIISDRLRAYLDGIEIVFGADTEHIQSEGMTGDINTNLIERFHGTLKDRTKVLRGFKTVDTALIILDGFLIHYNFFRPHMSLKDKTPADVAGIKSPYKTWTDFVRQDK